MPKRLNFFLKFMALLAIVHFAYFVFFRAQSTDLNEWNLQSCQLETRRNIISVDCLMPRKKAFMWAAPFLNYGETISCQNPTSPPAPVIALPRGCAEEAPDVWGYPQKTFDIGWDAYSTWYSRAALIYFLSQKPAWPGLATALYDPAFIKSVPAFEHRQYPWLVSAVYARILKIFHSPNPLPLQLLQFLMFVMAGFLYKLTWRRSPWALAVSFALVPIAGGFLFKLYGDLWIIFFNLLLLLALQNRRWALALVASVVVVQTKSEAWVQWLALMLTYAALSYRTAKESERRIFFAALLAGSLSTAMYLSWAARWPVPEFYTGVATRLIDARSWTDRLPKICAYYVEVLFRPLLWGILWPFCFWTFYKNRNSLRWALLPLIGVLVAIPLAYLRFPDGAYKVVVLTGSNRALWQLLPLNWLLLKTSFERTYLPT